MKKSSEHVLKIRAIAVTETLLAIGALVAINLFFFNGDRFVNVNPHPFWFIVVLISAQYGVSEGCFAALVASIAFLVGHVRPMNPGEYFYSYLFDIYAQPLLWLVTAFILGSLRFRHVAERDSIRTQLKEAFTREETIAEQYEKLKFIKETLEQRLVKQVRTTADAYHAAKLLETHEPDKVLEGSQVLVKTLIAPKKFSIYLFQGEQLKISIRHAWTRPDEFPSVIASSERLFEEVIGKKRIISVAKVKDEEILSRHGVLAGPIMADSGQILGMLKIEDIEFTDLHISTLQTFRIVCSWIGNAYFQAHGYQTASSLALLNPDNSLLSYEFFKLQVNYLTTFARRLNFDVTLVMVKFSGEIAMNGEQHRAAVQALGAVVKGRLRSTDQICNYHQAKDTFHIILPNTPEAHTPVVIGRLENALEQAGKEMGLPLKLSFAVQPIYRRQIEVT